MRSDGILRETGDFPGRAFRGTRLVLDRSSIEHGALAPRARVTGYVRSFDLRVVRWRKPRATGTVVAYESWVYEVT